MFDAERLIADRARAIDASGIRKVFDLAAQLENPINLSIGQTDFDVPEPIKEAACRAIRDGLNKYTVTQGMAELIERVRGSFSAAHGIDGRWDDYGTLITSGVSGGLMLAIMATVERGDRVIVPDPYFVMYKHLVRMAGGEAVYVDTYPDFLLTAERVEPLIDDHTKLLLYSSPSNPTGAVLGGEAIGDLAALCEQRGVLMVSDEIYDAFCYEKADTPTGPRTPSAADYTDHALILRGHSKSYGMTGWRLGYALGPRPVVEQMTKLQQYTFVCAPSMVQKAAALAVKDVDLAPYVRAYRRKRDMVVEKLSPHFELNIPDGAFYAFPKVPGDQTGTQFVERAIANNVLVIPGNVFSERDTHFRLSYACDDATLEQGLNVLVKLAE